MDKLTALTPGQIIPFGGNRAATVSPELAASFQPGDRLVVVQDTGDLLRIAQDVWELASAAVAQASVAFGRMGAVSDDQITAFYHAFADRLEDDESFAAVAEANQADIDVAAGKGRSTTRLVLSDTMRSDMIAGLRTWAGMPSSRGRVLEQVDHDQWSAELLTAGLGPVGFVFEGRPNVFADATGVLRSGNTVVFRIGSDALRTAEAIVETCLNPALAASGLPDGAVTLVASPERSAAWAMFSQPNLALAVARGSGAAVSQLGAVARQAGIPVSLHGTGGAWIMGVADTDPDQLELAVRHSLDRKVCNTLNTIAITRDAADTLVPAFLSGLLAAGERLGTNPKLHVADGSEAWVPDEWFDRELPIARAEGDVVESQAQSIGRDQLGEEWEWEQSPEVTLVVTETLDESIALFNTQSPKFAASLISDNEAQQRAFFDAIDAPFVGNGFTRWVDGQYALDRPELGLSNWQFGRLFGRGGVLSGDSVYTVRTKATQTSLDLGR